MYKGINEFKKALQPCTYVIKKDDDTIVADTTSMLSRWERFYSNLLKVNQSGSLEGSEMYTVEPDIPELSLVEVELAIVCVCGLQLPREPLRSTRLLQLTGRWQHDGIM